MSEITLEPGDERDLPDLQRTIEDDGANWRDRFEDVKRIMRISLDNGLIVTPQQAYAAWLCYSETSAAVWLFLDDEDEIVWLSVRSRLEMVGERA